MPSSYSQDQSTVQLHVHNVIYVRAYIYMQDILVKSAQGINNPSACKKQYYTHTHTHTCYAQEKLHLKVQVSVSFGGGGGGGGGGEALGYPSPPKCWEKLLISDQNGPNLPP